MSIDLRKVKLYVKKIVSLNPTEYYYIDLNIALHNYYIYTTQYGGEKNFINWLKTEI